MKRVVLLFSFVLMMNGAFALNFTVDGINYSTLTDSAVAVSQGVYSGSVAIPTSVIYNNVSYKVISIRGQAFWGCVDLTGIIIPSSVTTIGEYAFGNCTNLTSVDIPASVTSIGLGAFGNCSGLINVDAKNLNYVSADGILYNKTMTALLQCPISLKGNIILPSSVISIGYFAFGKCSGLTGITLPVSIDSIGYSAFFNCTSLKNINFPSSIKTIDNAAFSGCTSLTNINLPPSVASIRNITFLGCTNLVSITIPSSVTYIGGQSFSSCMTLTSITIPISVTSIGTSAFSDCTGLTSIYAYPKIPVSLKYSGYAFFNVNKSTCTLYVPIGSKALYQAATEWQDFTNIVEFDATSVKENLKTQPNLLYNPTTKSLQVSGVEGACSIEIYNSKGSLALRCTLQGNEPFTTNTLPKGMYVVRLTSGGTSFIKKIVIR